MSLPDPSASFTIPSVHDEIELDCRVYYPRYHEHCTHFFGRAFAILAHPYASLGGTYDDPVLSLVGSTLLQSGITLGVFNFRGAGDSAGRTSWTGRAELADYVSFYGFMLCCIEALNLGLEDNPVHDERPLLILGGYSYGSLITSCLPPYKVVARMFETPPQDSAAFEIKSRAEKLGRDLKAFFGVRRGGSLRRGRPSLRGADPDSPLAKRGVAMGGYESGAASRRISRESSRRSIDGERVRQSLDRARQRIRSHISADQSVPANPPLPTQDPVGGMQINHPQLAYLLVSPLLGPVSMLTTMFIRPTFECRNPQTGGVEWRDESNKEAKLTEHATCLIYGTKDVFTSSRRLHRWAESLRKQAPSTLTVHEVEGAGHFWVEKGMSTQLQSSVKGWLSELQSAAYSPISHQALTD